MRKRIGFFIVGLVLLAVGIASLRWVLVEQRREQQAVQKQREMLEARLDRVGDVVTGETDVNSLSGIAGGEKWGDEAGKPEAPREARELVFTISIVFVLAGGSIFGWYLLQSMLRLAFVIWCGLKRKLVNKEEPVREKKLSKVLVNSGWRDIGGSSESRYEGGNGKVGRRFSEGLSKSVVPDGSALDSRGGSPLSRDVQKIILPDSYERNRRLEDKLKVQADNLEKQVAEFRDMTQTVHKTALEHSEPLNNTLRELTEEVSAIREYATQQQERVRKLQDGYDWNIIRNFCLRIIRCIDNLESRINQLCEEGEETMYMEETRDELIFALESSGIEQFKPEIDSDYKGQEKFAEAVKDKECSSGVKMTGKIAKVLRQGYRYIIDDGNVRVVRPAQVKIYD